MAVVEGWVFVVAVQCRRDSDSGDGRKFHLSFVLVQFGLPSLISNLAQNSFISVKCVMEMSVISNGGFFLLDLSLSRGY